MVYRGVDTKIMRKGALDEAWWSVEVSEIPGKCQLTTLLLAYLISMLYSCRTFSPLGVVHSRSQSGAR